LKKPKIKHIRENPYGGELKHGGTIYGIKNLDSRGVFTATVYLRRGYGEQDYLAFKTLTNAWRWGIFKDCIKLILMVKKYGLIQAENIALV